MLPSGVLMGVGHWLLGEALNRSDICSEEDIELRDPSSGSYLEDRTLPAPYQQWLCRNCSPFRGLVNYATHLEYTGFRSPAVFPKADHRITLQSSTTHGFVHSASECNVV
jgi:hypothetical protein